MSALEKMIMQQVSKNLPQEVAKYLTPEGISELGAKAGQMVEQARGMLVLTIQQNADILANQREIMSVLNIEDKHVNRHSNIGQPAPGNSGSAERDAA